MKWLKMFVIWIFSFSVILSSCTSTSIAILTPTLTIAPSNTPHPTKSPTPDVNATPSYNDLALTYIEGKISDINYLTIEERTTFSEALVDELNKERGNSLLLYNNEAYFDPVSLRMKTMNDGSSIEEQTIQLYLPVSEDKRGNLLIKYEGEWVTISNSATVDWTMLITDPNDERIDWPTTETGENGLTSIQSFLSLKRAEDGEQIYVIKPIIIIDTKLGEIYLEGTPPGPGGHIGPGLINTMKMVTIITDDSGIPIAAMQSIFLRNSTAKSFVENSDVEFTDAWGFEKDGDFAKSLVRAQTYFLFMTIDQEFTFEKGIGIVMDGWNGLRIAGKGSEFLDNTAITNDALFIENIYGLIRRVNQ